MSDHSTILVVDDDDVFRTRLERAFVERGLEVRGAKTVESAVALARAESPELAVVDLKLDIDSGLTAVRELLAIDPTTRIVMLTGYGSIATAVEAMRLGAVDYLAKPADADEILAALDGKRSRQDHDVPQPASLARVEWEHIQRVLAECDGNVSHAAKVLGIHRRSLQRKLSKNPVQR